MFVFLSTKLLKITISWNLVLHIQKCFHELEIVKSLQRFYCRNYSEKYLNGRYKIQFRIFGFLIPILIWVKRHPFNFILLLYQLHYYHLFISSLIFWIILMRDILSYYRKVMGLEMLELESESRLYACFPNLFFLTLYDTLLDWHLFSIYTNRRKFLLVIQKTIVHTMTSEYSTWGCILP